MDLLNTLPLAGAILGIFLAILVAVGKGAHGNNKAAKFTLVIIVLLNVHNLLDAWVFYNQNAGWPGYGVSFLHYHLIGVLFLLYTYFLFKINVNLKLWGSVIMLYTIIRWAVLIPYDYSEIEEILSASEVTDDVLGFVVDYYVSLLLNIVLLLFTFLKIKNLKFYVELNQPERISYLWLKNLLIIAIVVYIAIFLSSIISIFNEGQWLFFMQLESLIVSLFCFAIAFAAIRFPVFAVYGDFDDLPVDAKAKYANSSLKIEESDQLWKQITEVMEKEKAYLNPTFRLNDLAEKTGESLHHISQLINQRQGMSFSDFVNQYRVQEAQSLLRSPRANEITILAIALEVGFNSKTAFYNSFKKITGKTPSAFKKELNTTSS